MAGCFPGCSAVRYGMSKPRSRNLLRDTATRQSRQRVSWTRVEDNGRARAREPIREPDDGGGRYLWNVGKLIPVYRALQPRRQPSSYSPPWEPQIVVFKEAVLKIRMQLRCFVRQWFGLKVTYCTSPSLQGGAAHLALVTRLQQTAAQWRCRLPLRRLQWRFVSGMNRAFFFSRICRFVRTARRTPNLTSRAVGTRDKAAKAWSW
jgi:hypothetical protein